MSEVTVESELRRLLAEAHALIDRMIDEREAEREKVAAELDWWEKRSAENLSAYYWLCDHKVVRFLTWLGVIRNV